MIKKFLFAISAVALLTACGGNAGETSNAEGSDQTATEQVQAGEGTVVEKANFTAIFPTNFKNAENFENDSRVLFRIPNPESEYGHLGQVQILAVPGWEKGVDAYIQDIKNGSNEATDGDDVTAAGITWKQLRKNALDNPIYLVAALPDKGVIEVNLQKIDVDNADVKAILESIKLK